jgi:hypothetical protein
MTGNLPNIVTPEHGSRHHCGTKFANPRLPIGAGPFLAMGRRRPPAAFDMKI